MQVDEFESEDPDWLYDEEFGCWYSSWDLAEWSSEDEYWMNNPDQWENPDAEDDTSTQPDPDAEEEPVKHNPKTPKPHDSNLN